MDTDPAWPNEAATLGSLTAPCNYPHSRSKTPKMAVRIRMKKMGRTHRPFFRICAMDKRSPRDGRVIEELGTYDPMVPETDARVTLNTERIAYWVSVGAQPSDAVAIFIKKYGVNGTHLDARKAALERLATRRNYTPVNTPPKPVKKAEPKAEEAPVDAAPAEEVAPAQE
jgi:small subunit ribosomal protein S16